MANALKIRPLYDRIVVEPETEKETKGGIVLPQNVDKEKPSRGKVIAIGEGKWADGKKQPVQVKVGEVILFGKYAGTNVELGDKEYLVLREEDVMGVIE